MKSATTKSLVRQSTQLTTGVQSIHKGLSQGVRKRIMDVINVLSLVSMIVEAFLAPGSFDQHMHAQNKQKHTLVGDISMQIIIFCGTFSVNIHCPAICFFSMLVHIQREFMLKNKTSNSPLGL
jgi:hypothetical protein